jgi:5-methylthioadenosine/S-adenosylhomocysteine deaminase
MRTIIEDVLTVTMNEQGDIDTYTIVIEEGRIGLLTKEKVRSARGDRVIGGAGKIALPGLFNGHVHSDMTLARGLGDGLTLYEQDRDSFISRKKWFRDELGKEVRYSAKLLQYIEALKGGVTFLCDVPFWSHGEDLVKPFREVGLMGAVVIDFREDFLGEVVISREEYFGILGHLRQNGLVPVVEGPSEENYDKVLMRKLAGWAEELDTFVQMHLAETSWRLKIVRDRFGKSSVRFLHDIGVLNERVMGSHGVFVDDEEIDLLGESGARIVNCPTAEMKIADGVAPVAKFIRNGIITSLGTDGALWNDCSDMFSEMKTLMLLQRVNHGAGSLSAEACLRAVTIDGARAFGLERELGSIESGKRATLVLVDYMKPHSVPVYHGKQSNILQVLTSCLRASDVDTVILDGTTVVEAGKVLTVDEEALVRTCQDLGVGIFRDMDP